jgi:DNA-binding transcriptional LysR family regulator
MNKMNFEGLDLNLLLVLDALCSELNATKAAKKIGFSQPGISRALGRLRKYFNDQLFIHTAGGLRPTARAEALRGPLHDALVTLGYALASPTLELQDWSGAIRIAMLDMEEFLLLPRLLNRVNRLAPNLRLEAVPLLGLSVAQLQDTSVDFAIGPIPTTSGPYVRQKLYADKFVCIVNASSPVAKGVFTMDAYVSARHLQLGLMDSEAPTQVEAALKRIGIKRNIVLRTHSLAAAYFILSDTDLILTIPSRVAERFASIGNLKIFDLPAEMEDLVVYQLWHERNQDDARHKWFRTQMKEAVAMRDKTRLPNHAASI